MNQVSVHPHCLCSHPTAVPDDVKQKAMALKPNVTISQNGDSWTFTTTLGDTSTDTVFKLDEEFDHQNLMGKIIKVRHITLCRRTYSTKSNSRAATIV